MYSKPEFSVIILTYNEEVHLPRLLSSLSGLNFDLFILDSFSTDNTIEIAKQFKATIEFRSFDNHPRQWDYALKTFNIKTPWIVALDADQIVLPKLYLKLNSFKDEAISTEVSGIYFNRKNYFKGRWIKYGGYFPKYMLKMFRVGKGKSDLNENMDHRFVVSGKTIIWKDGLIKEENLKENEITFWLEKHIRYARQVAAQEIEVAAKIKSFSLNKLLFPSYPDERIAAQKALWLALPLYWRPMLYFIYRFILKGGFLDGPKGRLFHFLHAFWFRIIIDEQISELREKIDQ